MSYVNGKIWGDKIPDRPHYAKATSGQVFCDPTQTWHEQCQLCGCEPEDGICFVHNEGCHSLHCIDCLERMVDLYYKKECEEER
jgi:hypothetical protein